MKQMPQRTCMGCNVKKDKKDLVRVVKNKEQKICIDITGKMDGRGAYICNSVECLDKVVKTKRLERVLECKLNEDIYMELRGVIIDKSEK